MQQTASSQVADKQGSRGEPRRDDAGKSGLPKVGSNLLIGEFVKGEFDTVSETKGFAVQSGDRKNEHVRPPGDLCQMDVRQ